MSLVGVSIYVSTEHRKLRRTKVAKNTKCLNCDTIHTNSFDLSFCGKCGEDRVYLVEYETSDTERQPTRNEILIAKMNFLETKLAEAQKTIDDLATKLGIILNG